MTQRNIFYKKKVFHAYEETQHIIPGK